METLGVNPSSTSKRYGYVYDGLNRLTDGYYQNPNNPNSKENTESLAYDLNGNITNLYRTSVLESGTNTAMVIDDLVYVYGTGGNQVTKIIRLIFGVHTRKRNVSFRFVSFRFVFDLR